MKNRHIILGLVLPLFFCGKLLAQEEDHGLTYRNANNGLGGLCYATYDYVGIDTHNAPPGIWRNDCVRSLILTNVRVGCVIQIDDSKHGDRSDDWCLITVKKTSPRYVVGSFETPIDDDYIKLEFFADDGHLDGKVSSIKIIN